MSKRIIVVLGSGRSGTSLLMQILHKFGMEVSDTMTPPSEQNQLGGYEDSKIFKVHSDIFNILKTNQTVPLPVNWLENPEIIKIKQQLSTIIETNIEKAQTIWGVKDPRIAILLPLWNLIFNALKIVPIYLLAVRNPSATVISLKKQYNRSEPVSELIWLHRNCAALSHTGSNCYVIHYEEWFRNPCDMAKELLDYTGLSNYFHDSPDTIISELVKPNLNRSTYKDYQVQNKYVSLLYDTLKDSKGNAFDGARLMSTVNDCNRVMDEFKGWYHIAQEHIEKQRELSLKIRKLTKELNTTHQKLDTTNHKLNNIDLENTDLKSIIRNNENYLKDLSDELENERKRIYNLTNELKEKQQTVNELSLIKKTSSFKIGNLMILAIKEPGWKTLRLPYDIAKCFWNIFKDNRKDLNQINNRKKDIAKGSNKIDDDQKLIDYHTALESAKNAKRKLNHEYALIENRIKKIKGQLSVANAKPGTETSNEIIANAVLKANATLLGLKDMENEILELKLNNRAQSLE